MIDGSVIFELNELEIFTSVFNSIELVNLYIKRTDFSYILKTNNRKTSASTITKLNSHPYRDISISNFIVSEKLKVLECKEIDGLISCKTIELDGEPYFAEQIANNNAELDFKIEEFSFLKDESQPYYRLKRIKFFASSIFQPHFPLDSSEFKMGKLSPKKMELIIPNNIKPEKPEFETDILFYKDIDKSWSLKNEKIKESKTEQLVRITLSQDFMKEGPNLLGVVLNKVTNGKQKVTDETSAIGEDITKLMENSKWGKNNNLEPKIRNKEDLKKLEDKVFSSIVSKYFPDFKDSKNIKVYKIGEEAYRVLHLKPFYNVTLKKWQVILSFKDLKQVETVFIRIVLMKIAKGYGLKEIKEELWSDTTGTNLSNFTKPDILPLYNTKHYKINKLSHKGSQALKIKIDSDVNYDKTKKVYVIMVSNSRKKSNILNVKEKNEKVKYGFEDIQVRKPLVIDNNAKNKNIVLFKGKEAIIERKGFKKLFLFEFEIHDNANKTIQDLELSEAIYLDFNPLFDPEKQNEGLRLINFQEFKV